VCSGRSAELLAGCQESRSAGGFLGDSEQQCGLSGDLTAAGCSWLQGVVILKITSCSYAMLLTHHPAVKALQGNFRFRLI